MAETNVNRDRLMRAIRCLQLLQRTNAPNSSLAKAAAKALTPLLKESAAMPPDVPPLEADAAGGAGG